MNLSSKSISHAGLVLIHIALGFVGISFPFVVKWVLLLVIVYFLFLVFQTQNTNNHALVAAAYVAGFEVFSRMTGGAFSYEFAKYMVVLFLSLGMFYRGFQRRSWPYLVFMLCLMPGIFAAGINLRYGTVFGNAIGFNLSGPLCLAISALYCYENPIDTKRFNDVFEAVQYPLIATVVYVFLYAPSLQSVLTGTGSNFAASGGFGPNQVATVLGLGIFISFVRLVMVQSRAVNLIDLGLMLFFAYRGLATFSRGGMLTAGICLLIFLLFYLVSQTPAVRLKVLVKSLLLSSGFLLSWLLVSLSSSGLINKRYANQDALGREKSSIGTGRLELANLELDAFYQNPVIGIGVGQAKEYRADRTGQIAASHSEVTRMIAEHGSFGILGLLILLLTPFGLWLRDRRNVFLFAFVGFWFLTINHSAMRIAMPAFIYGLALLQVKKAITDDQTEMIYNQESDAV